MFTGIVTAVGRVARIESRDHRTALVIEAPYPDLAPGESIAVAGACLTVVEVGQGWFRVDVVDTTQSRTRLAAFTVGDRVNLERALAAGERFGGHFVQGHVDGLGEVCAVSGGSGDALRLRVRLPPDVAKVTVPLGSIAVDGVSLTVSAMPEPDVVEVALIPFTREQTTLGALKVGDPVHVEGDVLGKYVRHALERGDGAD